MDEGSATNSCQSQNRMPNVPGDKSLHRNWKPAPAPGCYDANKLDQHFSPAERFATGLRNGEGFSFDSAGRIFVTQHGRDQLAENFPKPLQALEGANEPAEELVQLRRGADFGWPECYYDYDQKKLVLAPEYGGDGGKTVGVCAQKQEPAAAFPAHWAPNDMLIYEGNAVPNGLQGWGLHRVPRLLEPRAGAAGWLQRGVPAPGRRQGFRSVRCLRDGFAGPVKEPGRAAHRPPAWLSGLMDRCISRRCGWPHLARHLQAGTSPRGSRLRRLRLPMSRLRPAMLRRPRGFIRGRSRCAADPAWRVAGTGRVGRPHLPWAGRGRDMRWMSWSRTERGLT